MTLLHRIETAPEPSVELFSLAWSTIMFDRHGLHTTAWPQSVKEAANRFTAMLDAQAWTSAAEMLVPEGWFIYGMGEAVKPIIYKSDRHEHIGFWAEVQHRQGGRLCKSTAAAHPSLALLAAILKANGYE